MGSLGQHGQDDAHNVAFSPGWPTSESANLAYAADSSLKPLTTQNKQFTLEFTFFFIVPKIEKENHDTQAVYEPLIYKIKTIHVSWLPLDLEVSFSEG